MDLLGKFANFLTNSANIPQENTEGILAAFKTALVASNVHNFWIIDSGATDHITNKVSSLHDFEEISSPTHVSIANGNHVSVKGQGKIKILSHNTASSVLYIPSFPFQLLSIGRITKTLKCRVIFYAHRVIFQDLATKKTIGEGFFLQGLYYLSSSSQNNTKNQVSIFSSIRQEQSLWHQRLAHPSDSVLTKLMPHLEIKNFACDTCHLSKSTRLPFPTSTSRANRMFDVVHSDIWGPILESFDGYKYFVSFVDDFSRVTWIYLLKYKSEVMNIFQDFHMMIMTQFYTKIKIL